jgi:MoaA/NifB/PqqE/SkfB family radical SAM enzyme
MIEILHEKVARDIVPKADVLRVSSNGDPFFSKYYRELLFEKFNGDKLDILTNGLLFTKENWAKLKKEGRKIWLSVSVDAATPETYNKLRGGNFNVLIKNLEFMSELRNNGEIEGITITFVIQVANFREMKEFVDFGRKINVDNILFGRISNWGHMTDNEFAVMDVYNTDNPCHEEFTELITDPCFTDNQMGISITPLKRDWQGDTDYD